MIPVLLVNYNMFFGESLYVEMLSFIWVALFVSTDIKDHDVYMHAHTHNTPI